MWTRTELKSYAKDFLKKHYWKAFLVCLIFTLLTSSGNNNSSNNNSNDSFMGPEISINEHFNVEDNVVYDTGLSGIERFIGSMISFPINYIGASFFLLIVLLWIILSLFIGPLITVGKNRFFLKGFQGDVSMRYLFSTFNSNEFWGIFKCMFITSLKTLLWTLLFIIPGIIKSYEYRMVPYLLTKDPNLTSAEAIAISRELTNNHKLDIFVLDLSFIGWLLLGALLFGIGTFFVTPYYEASHARLYNVLSGNVD